MQTDAGGKYGAVRNRVVKVATGEPIPEDEPFFIFRARDQYALSALEYYYNECSQDCTEFHLQGMRKALHEFRRFEMEHPERMKQPGCTMGR